ncbi:hypothetical protein GUJ93_ZPchr0015g6771 [Zizania palustris]|uniref:Uncharacterized protein n=1 Tax=Zizania palustris TaxID=103762 RepID=A0A8J5TI63_ZIZPA|nr:hypothetical protein GUJ93_ZPchr0015g6771 [Zizania palustris]
MASPHATISPRHSCTRTRANVAMLALVPARRHAQPTAPCPRHDPPPNRMAPSAAPLAFAPTMHVHSPTPASSRRRSPVSLRTNALLTCLLPYVRAVCPIIEPDMHRSLLRYRSNITSSSSRHHGNHHPVASSKLHATLAANHPSTMAALWINSRRSPPPVSRRPAVALRL